MNSPPMTASSTTVLMVFVSSVRMSYSTDACGSTRRASCGQSSRRRVSRSSRSGCRRRGRPRRGTSPGCGGRPRRPARRSKPVGPQLADGAPLELPGGGVVAAVAHDQQVPAQLVALQPGQGLGLDPQRPAGEQDDRAGRVEQLQQPGHLVDERVVAARLEEGVPVRGRAPSRKCWRLAASDSTPSRSNTTAGPGDRPAAVPPPPVVRTSEPSGAHLLLGRRRRPPAA